MNKKNSSKLNEEYKIKRSEYRKRYIQKIRSNPKLYEEYKKKHNEQNKRYRQRVKDNPELYEKYKKYRNEYAKKYRHKLKETNPIEYQKWVSQIYKYSMHGKGRENRLKSQAKYRERKRQEPGYREKHNAYMREYRRKYKSNLEE